MGALFVICGDVGAVLRGGGSVHHRQRPRHRAGAARARAGASTLLPEPENPRAKP